MLLLILVHSTVFTEITNFQTDAGIAIGAGLDPKLFIENDNEGVVQNSAR